MFNLFLKKKEVEKIKEETKKGFENVKQDLSAVGEWIKHLDSEKKIHKKDIEEIKDILSTMKEEIEEMRNVFKMMNEIKIPSTVQTNKQLSNKQTAVYTVQSPVQTSVQTPNLDQFSVTERAILWILLNTELKLSYDDLAAMLNKERSTIRGQINTIKQKSDGIIKEIIEKNGKKRLYIPEELKEKVLKKTKVRLNNQKNTKRR